MPPTNHAAAPAVRSVHAISCGSLLLPRGLVVGGEGLAAAASPLRLPTLSFAIELADGGWIAVDAGLRPERPRLPLLGARSVVEQLRALGASGERLRAVVLTHLEVTERALRARKPASPASTTRATCPSWPRAGPCTSRATSGRTRCASRSSTSSSDAGRPPTTRGSSAREVLFDEAGEAPLPEAAGAAALVALPGHTPGHMGVLGRLASGGRLLLCGDACYAAEQIARAAPLGPFARLAMTDGPRARATLEGLRRRLRDEPGLAIVPSHDPATGAHCSGGPARIG